MIIKLLLYCTQSNKRLFFDTLSLKYMYGIDGKKDKFNALNGKILGTCDFEVEKIEYKHIHERDKFGILHNESWYEYRGINIGNEEDCDLPNKSCLSAEEIFDYLINKDGYAIHIKNLYIFDKPKELSDFFQPILPNPKHIKFANWIANYYWALGDYTTKNPKMTCKELVETFNKSISIKKAPQNMMHCWGVREGGGMMEDRFYMNILISIRPEHLCKILNHEKTVEVRKTVLKDML